MKNKINIAELLKDCPMGMELDCTIWDNIIFEEIDGNNIVIFRKSADAKVYLTQYGEFNSIDGKCVIFPKGKTTWEGFHRPFKDGDILFYKHKSNNVKYICIYKRRIDMHYLLQYCGWFSEKPHLIEQFNTKERMPLYENDDIRLATEEEKEKLFQAIKDNGYNWNAETKTLEKLVEPIFKVGNRVKKNKDYISGIVTDIFNDSFKVTYDGGGCSYVQFHYQHDLELVSNKFDINTLIPFESKVLVRNSYSGFWMPTFWGVYETEKSNEHQYRNYLTTKGFFRHCIPYNDDTKHLVGKTDDCDEYYKTWE